MNNRDDTKPMPTAEDLQRAHQEYLNVEPRDLFYKIATELIRLIKTKVTNITLPEAIASLLQTWNRAYYRFNKFTSVDFDHIESLLNKWESSLKEENCKNLSNDEINIVFRDFDEVLGPVAAAKCLHLLAPSFFPLWDRAIAAKYGFPLGKKGTNSARYIKFLEYTNDQRKQLEGDFKNKDILKLIDEYNYVTISMPEKRKSWEKIRIEAGALVEGATGK